MFWLRLAIVFLAVWLVLVSGFSVEDEEMDEDEQLARAILLERKAVCLPKPSYGCGKGKRKMWFFNVRENKCEKFIYSNCGGNRNRFFTRSECFEFCSDYNLRDYISNNQN